MDKETLKEGDTLICKKKYIYNGVFNIGDVFKIYSLINLYNIDLITPIGTHHIIPYKYQDCNNPCLYELFYSKSELRLLKILKLKNKISSS